MKRRLLVMLCLVLALLMTSVGALGEPVPSNTPIMINDVRTAFFAPDGAYLPVMEDAGCVYVPVCAMGESLKLDVTADAATLAVTVNGVRAAFFDESGAYLPPVVMNGVVYAPIQAFLDTCGVNYAHQDGAYLITLGAVEATAVPTAAPTAAPVYGYVPLNEYNFLDFFTVETGCSYPDINIDLRAYTVTHKLTCQATTSYGLENVSFKVGTFGTIRMPASGYVTDTHENTIYSYNYDNKKTYAFDQAITAELALLTTYPLESASGKLRMSWQEAQTLNQSYYEYAEVYLGLGAYDKAITMFNSLASVDYADSADRAKAARDAKAAAEKAAADKAQQEKEDKYNQAIAAMEQQDYATAIPMLEALSDESYKDSDDKLAEARNGEMQQQYDAADAAFAQGDYNTALVIFTSLADGGYADAADRVAAVHYAIAEQYMVAGKYQEAADAFIAAGNYSDAAARTKEAWYLHADACMSAGDYENASSFFAASFSYQDAAARKQEADYQQALLEEAGENYTRARDLYNALGDYKDSADRAGQMAMAIELAKAEKMLAAGDYLGVLDMIPRETDDPELQRLHWQAQFRYWGTTGPMNEAGSGWVERGNYYALMDYQGNVLTTGEFASVSDWSEGLSAVQKADGTWVYYNAKGEVPFGGYAAAESFHQGKALVTTMDNRVCVIDVTGAEVAELPAKEGRKYRSYLGEELVSFEEKGKVGLINLAGKVILKPKYNAARNNVESIFRFQYGLARIADYKSNKCGVINAKGKEVVALGKYKRVTILGEDMLAVNDKKEERKNKLVTLKGKNIETRKNATYFDVERQGDLIICEYPGGTRTVYNLNMEKLHTVEGLIDVGYNSELIFTFHNSYKSLKTEYGIALRSEKLSSTTRYQTIYITPDSPYTVWYDYTNKCYVIVDKDANTTF